MKYGDIPIVHIRLLRSPVMGMITRLLNSVNYDKEPFDKLFHLSMVCLLKNGLKILLEKNEIINIELYKHKSDEEYNRLDIVS